MKLRNPLLRAMASRPQASEPGCNRAQAPAASSEAPTCQTPSPAPCAC